MRGRILAASLLLGLLGCLPDATRLALVPGEPTARHLAARPPQGATPPNEELARRVALAGQRLMASNRSLDVRPHFTTLGVPHEELFHRGLDEIYISEGLVERCQNEGQLVALLALALGRGMAEREVLSGPGVSRPLPRLLPEEVAVGNDTAGPHGAPDGTRLMELARLEKASRASAAPPEPESLARSYLRRAGFTDADLKAAESLAQLADANGRLNRQLAPR